MTFVLTYSTLILINVIGMIRAFIINVIRKRAGIVDIGWAVCMIVNAGLPALNRYIQEPNTPLYFWVLPIIFVVWYTRLGLYLLSRYVRDTEEDSRYAAMRNKMGKNQHVGFFVFFMCQVLIALGLSFPLWQWSLLSNELIESISLLQWFFVIAWVLFAFAGQSVSDYQLSQFKKNPDNKKNVMQFGLWKFSRHPNYFFEWLFWLHLAVVGLWIGYYYWLLYPIVMYVFLRYLTGIPFSEQQALKKRGESYERYQEKTSAFFILPKKKQS